LPEKPELITMDILKAFKLGVLDRDEVRNILNGVGWEIKISQVEESSRAMKKA